MTGRSDFCPCGSGKKFKRCCWLKPLSEISANGMFPDCLPCDGPAPGSRHGGPRCGARSVNSAICKLCGPSDELNPNGSSPKQYAWCHEHRDVVNTLLKGHIVRVHPDAVPDIIDQLVRSPEQLAGIRAQAALHPEMWQKLMAAIDERGLKS